MKINKEQFKKYLKENKRTLAIVESEFRDIPAGTKLYFSKNWEYISSFDCDNENLNEQFGYKFDYEWDESWETYEGYFIIEDSQQPLKHESDKDKSYEVEKSPLSIKTEQGSIQSSGLEDHSPRDSPADFKVHESIPTKIEYKGRTYVLEKKE